MERTKRTKEETIALFRMYANEYYKKWDKNDDFFALEKAQAYEMAAFELEKNLE